MVCFCLPMENSTGDSIGPLKRMQLVAIDWGELVINSRINKKREALYKLSRYFHIPSDFHTIEWMFFFCLRIGVYPIQFTAVFLGKCFFNSAGMEVLCSKLWDDPMAQSPSIAGREFDQRHLCQHRFSGNTDGHDIEITGESLWTAIHNSPPVN